MGLEIFYDLHTPPAWDAPRVRSVVLAARRRALTLGFAEVDEVKRNELDHPRTMGVRRLPKNFPRSYFSANATDGWFFRTWPGEGCETAIFGLCQFAAHVEAEGRSVAFGWRAGWHFHSWCKTQYADLVSREHFLKCHLGVISILDFFRAEGCLVRVRDGGDYWKSRRVERLAGRLQRMHAVVAAVVGGIKGASENVAGQFIAPIARHPQFEPLEAQGRAMMNRKRQRRAARKK